MTPLRRAAAALLLAALAGGLAGGLAAPPAARGQAPGLDQGGSGPVEITASNGIEWDRARSRYIASGDAKATRGDTTVEADRLIAYYRERPGQGSQIYRYEAVGNVRITTATQQAEAEQAVYDIDSGVMVMRGNNLRITTQNEVVTARDSMEYWTERHLAVARGDATVVTRDDRRMRADMLAVYMLAPGEQLATPAAARPARPGAAAAPARPAAAAGPGPLVPGPSDSNRVKRVEAFGNVLIAAPPSIARGDRGVYSAETRLATITGNVKLTHCENQIDGDSAEVNMDTGVSRMLSRPGGEGRVRALLVPGQAPQMAGQPGSQPGAQAGAASPSSDQCRTAGPPGAPGPGAPIPGPAAPQPRGGTPRR